MALLQRVSSWFVRLSLFLDVLLFAGGFGFVLSGIFFGILVSCFFSVAAVNRAYETLPWGIEAWLIAGGEALGVLAGGWVAWWFSGETFRALSSFHRRFFPLSLAAFLALESLAIGSSLPRLLRLAYHSQVTTGEVLELHPENHNSLSYRYTVGGTRYRCGGSIGDRTDLHPGSALKVYYSPQYPNECTLKEPRAEMWDDLEQYVVLGLWVCVGPFGLIGGVTFVGQTLSDRRERRAKRAAKDALPS